MVSFLICGTAECGASHRRRCSPTPTRIADAPWGFLIQLAVLFFIFIVPCCLGAPTTREMTFPVDAHSAMINGKMVPIASVGGNIVAPVIHVQRGDRLIVHLSPTSAIRGISIHWHGLEMHGNQAYDGVVGLTQCTVQPGTTYTYDFVVNEVPGTYWWHTHSGGSMPGLHNFVRAPFIVHESEVPADALVTPLAYGNERIVFMTDLFEDAAEEMMLKTAGGLHEIQSRGDSGDLVGTVTWWGGLINGAESATEGTAFRVDAGQTFRFRLINGASIFALEVSFPGLRMRVVATDAAPIAIPMDFDSIIINPAERFDVDVFFPLDMAGTSRYFVARTLESPLMGLDDHNIKAIIRIGPGAPLMPPDTLPAAPPDSKTLNCYTGQRSMSAPTECLPITVLSSNPIVSIASRPVEFHTVDIKFNPPPIFVHLVSLDGSPFTQHVSPLHPLLDESLHAELHPHTLITDLTLDSTIIFILRSNNRMLHPMHFHGHKFEVLDVHAPVQSEACNLFVCKFDEYFNSPEKIEELKSRPQTGVIKDTVALPAGGSVAIRFVADNPGLWFAHCHNDLHMEDGMAFIMREGGSAATAGVTIPADFPVCPPVTTMKEQPSCTCLVEHDQLRIFQLGPDPHHCSRAYLCTHTQNGNHFAALVPQYPNGIKMHSRDYAYIIFASFIAALAAVYVFTSKTDWFKTHLRKKVVTDKHSVQSFWTEYIAECKVAARECVNKARVLEVVGLALITGVVFLNVGSDTIQRGLRENVSLLFFSVTLWTFTRMYPAVPAHNAWTKRVVARLVPTDAIGTNFPTPSFVSVMRLSMIRAAVYFSVESWWPLIFGIITFPMAGVNNIVEIWLQHIALLSLNTMCYISFGALLGTMIPTVPVAMISSTLYAQTSLVCAGFYRTLPSWLAWIRHISYVFYTFSGMVRGAFHWNDTYSCRQGDSRAGQLWCFLETAGVIEDLKIRGINVATSDDPNSARVWPYLFVLIAFYMFNNFLIGLALYYRVRMHARARVAPHSGGTALQETMYSFRTETVTDTEDGANVLSEDEKDVDENADDLDLTVGSGGKEGFDSLGKVEVQTPNGFESPDATVAPETIVLCEDIHHRKGKDHAHHSHPPHETHSSSATSPTPDTD